MKIGLDGNSLPGNRTGIGIYTENLLKEFSKINNNDQFYILCNFWKNHYEKKDRINYVKKDNFKYIIKKIPESFFRFSTRFLKMNIEKYLGDIDIFHSPGFYFIPTKRAKLIVTIHDAAVDLYPQFFPKEILKTTRNAIKKSLQNSEGIIFDSNASKNDCFNIYGNAEHSENIVIHLGVDKDFFYPVNKKRLNEFRNSFNLPDSFILTIGTIEPRKNYKNIIKAFEKIANDNKNLHLVIAGKKGWLFKDIFSLIENSKFKDRIIYLDYIPSEDLPFLYSAAELFLFPSHYEGFGLPVTEAQACGIPVVCSDKGSLKEVVSDSAFIVPPMNVTAIADGIKKVLSDEELRNRLIERGTENSRKFTWKKTAQQTLEFYKKISTQPAENKIIENL